MTVTELIANLQKEDPNRLVVLPPEVQAASDSLRTVRLLEELFCAILNGWSCDGKPWNWEKDSAMGKVERFLLTRGRRLTKAVPAMFEDVPVWGKGLIHKTREVAAQAIVDRRYLGSGTTTGEGGADIAAIGGLPAKPPWTCLSFRELTREDLELLQSAKWTCNGTVKIINLPEGNSICFFDKDGKEQTLPVEEEALILHGDPSIPAPRWIIDANGPTGRCCALDAGDNCCMKDARWKAVWLEQGGEDCTFVCAEHLEMARRDREVVRVEEVK